MHGTGCSVAATVPDINLPHPPHSQHISAYFGATHLSLAIHFGATHLSLAITAHFGATHEWHSRSYNYLVSKELSPRASLDLSMWLGCIIKL
ncbi:MAG: hypothetical protein KatS3mg111_0032 [Pirellulaceae bacterium]|nr:MAG: hypothetical protein KatS3mg111_0032 [Pirellulaceae bacterium]